MAKKIDPAVKIQRMVKQQNEIVRDNVFTESIGIFGAKAIFINDCIKQIMTEHYLNYQDANLQAAFVRVAMGVYKMNYPKLKQKPILDRSNK